MNTVKSESIKKSQMQSMLNKHPDNPEIQSALLKLKKAEEDLKTAVETLKENCSHTEKVPVIEYDPDYSNRFDMPLYKYGANIFIGEFCLTCHTFEPRKKGMPWSVCYMCGGNMKYQGTFQAYQDSHGSTHKCENCGHIYDTT